MNNESIGAKDLAGKLISQEEIWKPNLQK